MHISTGFNEQEYDRLYFKLLEIRSMERGICPIAVFYFCIKTFFLYNVISQQRYQCY